MARQHYNDVYPRILEDTSFCARADDPDHICQTDIPVCRRKKLPPLSSLLPLYKPNLSPSTNQPSCCGYDGPYMAISGQTMTEPYSKIVTPKESPIQTQIVHRSVDNHMFRAEKDPRCSREVLIPDDYRLNTALVPMPHPLVAAPPNHFPVCPDSVREQYYIPVSHFPNGFLGQVLNVPYSNPKNHVLLDLYGRQVIPVTNKVLKNPEIRTSEANPGKISTVIPMVPPMESRSLLNDVHSIPDDSFRRTTSYDSIRDIQLVQQRRPFPGEQPFNRYNIFASSPSLLYSDNSTDSFHNFRPDNSCRRLENLQMSDNSHITSFNPDMEVEHNSKNSPTRAHQPVIFAEKTNIETSKGDATLDGKCGKATELDSMSEKKRRYLARSLKRRTCEICKKVCSRPSTLKTHMLIHSGALPFACEFPGCNRRFNVKSNLTRHIRSCHRGSIP